MNGKAKAYRNEKYTFRLNAKDMNARLRSFAPTKYKDQELTVTTAQAMPF